jgi:hypothetical protein
MEHDRHVLLPFRREPARPAANDPLSPTDPLDLFTSEEPAAGAPYVPTPSVGDPLDVFVSEDAPHEVTSGVSETTQVPSAARLPTHTGFWVVVDSLIPIAIGTAAVYYFFLR